MVNISNNVCLKVFFLSFFFHSFSLCITILYYCTIVFLSKVFISSSIFNANVMVEVAIKKAKSPVAVVADTFNMPEVSQAQPFLSLPGKLMVPR